MIYVTTAPCSTVAILKTVFVDCAYFLHMITINSSCQLENTSQFTIVNK